MKSMVFQEEIYKHKKEPAPVLNWGWNPIYLDNFEHISFSRLILSLFRRPTPSLSITWYWYCTSSPQLYQKGDYDTGVFLRILQVFSTCNFIKKESPAQVFSSEF